MAAGPGIAAGGAALRQGPADTAATPGKNEFAAKLPLLIAVNMLGPWSAAGFSMLLGAVLVLKGFALADALFYVALLKMGQTFGAIAGGILVDRFERRTTLIFAAGSMAVVGAAFGMSGEPAVLILIGALYTAISAVYVPLVGLYGAEIFSTARRARATTLASAANRVSAIVVPLVLLPVLQSVGPQLLYVLTGFILVAIVSLLVLFGPITGDRRNAD